MIGCRSQQPERREAPPFAALTFMVALSLLAGDGDGAEGYLVLLERGLEYRVPPDGRSA